MIEKLKTNDNEIENDICEMVGEFLKTCFLSTLKNKIVVSNKNQIKVFLRNGNVVTIVFKSLKEIL